jgi:hypothetical protein
VPTTAVDTKLRSLTLRTRSIWVRSRVRSLKFPPVIRMRLAMTSRMSCSSGSDASRRPSLFEQLLHLSSVERTELVDKPDARVELRKASDTFLYTPACR